MHVSDSHTFHGIMASLTAPARFSIIRHGESEGNVAGRMQGHTDLPLTERGRDQARSTGRAFAHHRVVADYVYASPLSRAFETARIIADEARWPSPDPLEAAKELDTGIFTGLTFPEIRRTYAEEYARFTVTSWAGVPGAESIRSLIERALATWREMVERVNTLAAHGADTTRPLHVATVTHGGMIQWLIKTSYGASVDNPAAWMPLVSASNCGHFELGARPVSPPEGEEGGRWYYAQWSKMNDHPTADHAQARELFHTEGGEAR